uniref:Uncharacterized protein n=1 Tax=Romanomermis culicivorax TaxID=13658 RepID=A0A915K103_ROMCU
MTSVTAVALALLRLTRAPRY